MKLKVKVLCDACKKCSNFELYLDEECLNGEQYEAIYCCRNLEICKNAIEIWQKFIRRIGSKIPSENEEETMTITLSDDGFAGEEESNDLESAHA